MLDARTIIKEKDKLEKVLRYRDPNLSLDKAYYLAFQRRDLIGQVEELNSAINTGSKSFEKSTNETPELSSIRNELRAKRERRRSLEEQLRETEKNLNEELLGLPNIITDRVPISQRKKDYVVISEYGSKPVFQYKIKDHVELATNKEILDLARGAKIAQSGFPLFKKEGALLEWGLIQFMIDHSVKSEFDFYLLPLLNNCESLTASGNLPKFSDEVYTCERDNLFPIPTAEVPLTNLFRGEVINEETLPIRMVAYTPCFRREAGAHGSATRGLMRVHQFNKVETYSICKPEDSEYELNFLVGNAESILENLGLHYRTIQLPSCDLADQSAETKDIEVWLPFDQKYTEVSSASNCLDYQARRANIKYKGKSGKMFVHTLNCSALATPRLMISLLETYQTKDGSINIPEALRSYIGKDKI